MFFAKKIRQFISIFCVGVVLMPMMMSVSASAADKRHTGYPERMLIGQTVALDKFCDEKGTAIKIQPKEGQYTIMTYWASWCSDCQEEFSYLPKLKEVLKDYSNVQWYLVDRVDGHKEDLQSGAAFIKNKNIGLPVVYDKDLKFSNSVGIVQIPTTIILDPQGKAVVCYPNIIKSQGHLRAMIDYATKGADHATFDYLRKNLLKQDGSLKSSKTDSPAQSLLAEYAANTLNPELLDQQREWIAENGGTTENLGNDLRMLRAFSGWRGYEVDSLDMKHRIVNRYFPGNRLNGTVKLSDLDLSALGLLQNRKLSQAALEVVQKGYISEKFPMYKTEYNTENNSYSSGNIDMTESLMTVYHLAQQGKVKKQTIEWLRKAVEGNGIKAKYSKDGKVLERYNYESPAVYALTALIALECDEQMLFTESLIQMEKSRTFDTANKQNGSFKSDDSDKALQQCLPLLLYSEMQQKMA